MKRTSILFLTIAFFVCCQTNPTNYGSKHHEPMVPTLSALQDSSEHFHDQIIELTGRLNYGFEDFAVYLASNDDQGDAVWIELSKQLADTLSIQVLNELANSKIVIQGRYDSVDTGHLGLFLGTIKADYLETVH